MCLYIKLSLPNLKETKNEITQTRSASYEGISNKPPLKITTESESWSIYIIISSLPPSLHVS